MHVDDDNGDGVGDSVDCSDDSANKHLTHPSQAVDCYLAKRSKQIKCVDGDKDDGVDDSDDGGDKHLTHFSQLVDCHLMERSKQIRCVDGNKDNGVDDSVGNSDDG
eukprot:8790218-Ditylum_brightwellii.AAC.1